jgi:hypothetical protein
VATSPDPSLVRRGILGRATPGARLVVGRSHLGHCDLWRDITLLYLPACVVFILHLLRVAREPLGSDEAVNLQVPLNLALGNGYQTWFGGPHPFDHRITTGPTVLLPAALVLRVMPPTAIAGRAVMVLFFAAFLVTLYAFSRQLVPRRYRAFFALSLCFVAVLPTFIALSATVMGEIPSLSFYLLALVVAARRDASLRGCAVAGLCFGLGALTKLTVAMCLPILLLTLGARLIHRGFRALAGGLSLCGLSATMPLLVWQAWKAGALGVPRYRAALRKTIWFIQSHGSGADRMPFTDLPGTVSRHLATISNVLQHRPLVIGVALLLVIVCGTIVWLRHGRPLLGFATLASATLLTGWWLALSNWSLYRHALPGYIFVALTCAYLLVEGVPTLRQAPWLDKLVVVIGAGAIVFCLPGATGGSATVLQGAWASQNDLSVLIRQIRQREPDAAFWAYGFFHAPEVSYLAATPFRDLTQEEPAEGMPHYLVVGPHFGAPEVDTFANRYCAADLYLRGFYRLCRLRSWP